MKHWCGLCIVYTLLTLSVFVFISNGWAQQKPLRFLTPKDGLPQSFVTGLVQDKDGFVWIATRNGLARYDGRHFKLFRHSARDTATLHSNLINNIFLDGQNRIWLNYNSYGLDCFDPVTEKVTHVSDEPLFRAHPPEQFWLATSDGNLWYWGNDRATRLYDRTHQRFYRFSTINGQPSDDSIANSATEDRQRRVWTATRLGLNRYDPATGRFDRFLFPDSLLHQEFFLQLHQRSNGEMMMSSRGMFIFFNPVQKTFRTVPFPQYKPFENLFLQTGPDGADYFQCSGTIYRYDLQNQLTALIRQNDFLKNNPMALLIDRAGLLWIGLNTGGICQVDTKALPFEVHPNKTAFQYDLLKQVFGPQIDWFGSWSPADSAFGGSGYFFRSAYDARHRLWIGLRNKVGYYDSVSQIWTTLPPIPNIESLSLDGGLRGVDFAPDGRLWVADIANFLGYFDTIRQRWVHFIDPLKAGNLQNSGIITDIKVDTEKIWLTAGPKLLCLDIPTRRMDVFNQQTRPGMLPTDDLLGMERDATRPHLLWIGSYEGLICLNKQTLATEIFTTNQGLPDNTIYSILTDNQGYLWLSTNQGLCRFHPVTHQVQNFKAEDGLPGNEFNRFHHLKLPDGRLAFGGIDGWVLFAPATIQTDTYQPQVAFTGLRIYNEPVSYSPGSKLVPRPLNDLPDLVLPYDENTLTFEFAGLEYSQPGKLHYRYRLHGVDDKWVTTDNPVINYTKLPAGHYTLQINCTNTSGQWSSYIRTINIQVLPPWWQTGWAYTGYLLVLAAVGYVLYRSWLRKQKAQQQFILQQKEAEQLRAVDEMKSRFFSNITHEFRTPLSLIMAPAAQMQDEEPSPGWKGKATIIRRNADQLLQLINQLLDMAKLEAASMKVSLFRGNITDFLEEITRSFTVAAAEKGIQLQVQAEALTEEYLFDAYKLQTILSNLLSNAIKFTLAGGCIQLQLEQEYRDETKSDFRFRVVDNGIGIPPEKLLFIFNRFYQADDSSTRSYGGTGIGLALARELAELMHGTLTATSEQGNGTTFSLVLPLAKAKDTMAPAYLPAPVLSEGPDFSGVPEEGSDTATIDKPLILVVEDNVALNTYLAQLFQQQYRVLTANNGVEGLRIANDELPDVIISDWMMPGMDGPSFCQDIKGSLATNHIAFILLTAKAAPHNRIEGLQHSADDYIVKPFLVEELQLRIANLLERQHRLREKLYQQLSQPGGLKEQRVSNAAPTPEELFLKQIYTFIEDKLDDSSFGVEELTVCIGMSRTNLQRKLKLLAGLPPGTLIRNYRLQRAAQFLREGSNSSETAYKTGFETPAYFSKCFGDFYGLTPTEFIRQQG